MVGNDLWAVALTCAILLPGAYSLLASSIVQGTVRQSPCNGADGSWVWKQDRDGAEYYNLASASDEKVGLAQKRFQPQGDQRFINEFMWEWKPSRADCEFAKMNRDNFCAAMEKRGLARFLMIGDSISYMMAESFWGLVGGTGDVGRQLSDLQQRIDCPGGQVLFSYIRNDHLTNSSEAEDCGDICRPWWSKYLADGRPTLLLVNTGIHTHSMERFAGDFDDFISRLASVSHLRPKDLLYYRLTLPGHEDCWSKDTPFQSPGQFSLDGALARRHSWNLVPSFNQYVNETVSRFAASQKLHLSVLDPYTLTILRPDGHRGDIGDCLHYYLPGVVDWWNHLLATMLLDA